jgi:opacity protein-like surface antigen
VYGTGGYARADIGFSAVQPADPNDLDNTYAESTANGWNVGVGFEHLFSDTVILGVEYLHAELSDGAVRFESGEGDVVFADVSSSMDLVRLRMSVSIDGLTRGK